MFGTNLKARLLTSNRIQGPSQINLVIPRSASQTLDIDVSNVIKPPNNCDHSISNRVDRRGHPTYCECGEVTRPL
ncbi:unnamed protein product [Lasius platythorax]|uniref:Uncharacterized protein n=1 Tax=Lasius platythorax TaxID=488582 RepID=A0AAV2N0W3_9HYME